MNMKLSGPAFYAGFKVESFHSSPLFHFLKNVEIDDFLEGLDLLLLSDFPTSCICSHDAGG